MATPYGRERRVNVSSSLTFTFLKKNNKFQFITMISARKFSKINSEMSDYWQSSIIQVVV